MMSIEVLKWIGHTPEWYQNKFLEVKSAMKKLMDQNLCVPDDMHDQYNWLVEQLKNS